MLSWATHFCSNYTYCLSFHISSYSEQCNGDDCQCLCTVCELGCFRGLVSIILHHLLQCLLSTTEQNCQKVKKKKVLPTPFNTVNIRVLRAGVEHEFHVTASLEIDGKVFEREKSKPEKIKLGMAWVCILDSLIYLSLAFFLGLFWCSLSRLQRI